MMKISETDDEIKDAEVYLYTRPIQSSSSLQLKEGISALGDIVQHWIFVVVFEEKNLYLEALQQGTLLLPSVSYNAPNGVTKRSFLGKTKVSPAYVVMRAVKNSHNFSKYDVFFKNCQNWFLEMYQYLGLDPAKCPIPIKEYISVIKMISTSVYAGLSIANMVNNAGLGFFPSIFSSAAVSISTFANQNPSENLCFRSLPSGSSQKDKKKEH